jgi:hypothetical protein
MDSLRSRVGSKERREAPLVRVLLCEDVRLEGGKEYFVKGEIEKPNQAISSSVLFSPNKTKLTQVNVWLLMLSSILPMVHVLSVY